jgi:hypothetical protein
MHLIIQNLNYKITKKTITLVPTCFGSYKSRPQGAVQYLVTCLHGDPYTTQTRTQDHTMPYIDYLQADVH